VEVWAGGRRGARLARPTRKHTCSTVQSGKAVTRYRVPLQKNAWGERGSARARGRARAPPPPPPSHHVAHVLARGHGGDAVKGKVHGGDLFKNFGLGGETGPRAWRAGREGATVSALAGASHPPNRFWTLRPPARAVPAPSAPPTSRSGGIGARASQSHAPLPREAPPAAGGGAGAAAAVMRSRADRGERVVARCGVSRRARSTPTRTPAAAGSTATPAPAAAAHSLVTRP